MLVVLTEIEKITPPTTKWAKEVCRMGQGHDCCRYLTMGPDGWSCQKHGQFTALLDSRALAREMVARADNCEGRAS